MRATDGQAQPRRGLTRREFFTRPLAWVTREPAPAGPGDDIPGRIPLCILREIPAAALMRMTPVLRRGWAVRLGETGVAYRGDSGQEGIVFLDPSGCAAARLFDGRRTLEQVAATIAAGLGLPQGHAVDIVRTTFLALADREVYHPNAPPNVLPASSPTGDRHA